MTYSGARGKLIYEKNLKSEISCQTPFNSSTDQNLFTFNMPIIALYTPRFYSTPCVFDVGLGSINYSGKWEGVGPWKSRLFWALWNSIEPIGECHLMPKTLSHCSPHPIPPSRTYKKSTGNCKVYNGTLRYIKVCMYCMFILSSYLLSHLFCKKVWHRGLLNYTDTKALSAFLKNWPAGKFSDINLPS
jgi:hypothetical protein